MKHLSDEEPVASYYPTPIYDEVVRVTEIDPAKKMNEDVAPSLEEPTVPMDDEDEDDEDEDDEDEWVEDEDDEEDDDDWVED